MQAKRNRIAPTGLFSLLFISRLVVSMITMQSVYTGKAGSDIIISAVCALGAVLVLSLPSVYCIKMKKNPLSVRWVSTIYGLYFILLAALNISRFSYFTSTTLNPESTVWIYAVVVTVCAAYASLLGIEALSRFSGFAFVLLVLGIIVVIICNAGNINEINLYPVISSGSENMLKNVMVFTTSTIEPALFLCLSLRVNGVAVKQFVASLLTAFTVIIILFYIAVSVMGDYTFTQQFPIYGLLEQASMGGFRRIDVIHISFWLFGVFIKCALLLYCASVCFGSMKQKHSCLLCSAAALALAQLFNSVNCNTNIFFAGIAVLFFVFCFIVPLMMLAFGKRNYGDELVQAF